MLESSQFDHLKLRLRHLVMEKMSYEPKATLVLGNSKRELTATKGLIIHQL